MLIGGLGHPISIVKQIFGQQNQYKGTNRVAVTSSAENLSNLKERYKEQVTKALKHLEYSYKKSLHLPMTGKRSG